MERGEREREEQVGRARGALSLPGQRSPGLAARDACRVGGRWRGEHTKSWLQRFGKGKSKEKERRRGKEARGSENEGKSEGRTKVLKKIDWCRTGIE